MKWVVVTTVLVLYNYFLNCVCANIWRAANDRSIRYDDLEQIELAL